MNIHHITLFFLALLHRYSG